LRCHRVVRIVDEHHGERFLVRVATAAGTALALTPLVVALLLVEAADLVFEIDSIPAIFAITGDPFLVFTSNVFAMLGLRSLSCALAGLVDRFRYLKPALAAVLLVVGGKMLAAEQLHAWLGPRFNFLLLATVVGILATGVAASLAAERRGRSAREEAAVGIP